MEITVCAQQGQTGGDVSASAMKAAEEVYIFCSHIRLQRGCWPFLNMSKTQKPVTKVKESFGTS